MTLPSVPGAYLLEIALPGDLRVEIRNDPWTLPAGRYLYCGSAYGPGGIAARVGRHRRRGKQVRWHIDRLTAVAPIVAARAYPGGTECALAADWLALGAEVIVPGFGSSDCRGCPTHLLRVPDGVAEPRSGFGR